jgi:hypothetical protein
MAQVRGPYRFRELARVEIGSNVWLVVSLRMPDNRIVVAKANIAIVEDRPKLMFLPDPLILKDIETLGSVGNCFLDAYEKLIPTVDEEASNQEASSK